MLCCIPIPEPTCKSLGTSPMKHFLKYEKKSGREIIPNSQKVFILDLREIHPSGSNYQGCNMKIYIQIIQSSSMKYAVAQRAPRMSEINSSAFFVVGLAQRVFFRLCLKTACCNQTWNLMLSESYAAHWIS